MDVCKCRLRMGDMQPDIICANKSFLDKSTHNVPLEGYAVVARRDRADGRTFGCILVICKKGA